MRKLVPCYNLMDRIDLPIKHLALHYCPHNTPDPIKTIRLQQQPKPTSTQS